MEARSVVAVILAITICIAILSPIVFRFMGKGQGNVPEAVINSLTDLLKVALGALVGWLAK